MTRSVARRRGKRGGRPQRRSVLCALGALGAQLVMAARSPLAAGAGATLRSPGRDDGLCKAARIRGQEFGAAVSGRNLEDPRFVEALTTDCCFLVPENAMKWDQVAPLPGVLDFSRVDRLMSFAENHGLGIHGHTAVWHLAIPGWFDFERPPDVIADDMRAFVEALIGRYRGRVRRWDVVNEPIAPEDGAPDGLRRSPWLERIGPNYIDQALVAAASADPQTSLSINEFGIEEATPQAAAKREALIALAERLVSRGVPLHSIGIQGHLDAAGAPIDGEGLWRFCDRARAAGLTVAITELDVRDSAPPATIEARDQRIASRYAEFLDAMIAHPALSSLATWGLSDRDSWIRREAPSSREARLQRPLPRDSELGRKAAWYAIYYRLL